MKPRGVISKDVSRRLERRFGKLKIGHVGTLDPNAEGVLPILIGKATRVQDWLLELPKTYEFTVKFGEETDSLDSDGQLVHTMPWEHLTEESLRAVLPRFIGDIEQIPPMYSAVKFRGRPLYEYARKDIEVGVPLEQLKRRVHVMSYELLSYADGIGRFRVRCSKGTYVRILVKDVAEAVGTCGTVIELSRTEAAGVMLAETVSLDALEQGTVTIEDSLMPLSRLSLGGSLRWQALNPGQIQFLRQGRDLVVSCTDFIAGAGQKLTQEGTGIVDESRQPIVAGWAKSLMLFDVDGSVFGIGAMKRHPSGMVQINLKRGLQ